ncbi:2-keto-4-pentenoate hydratase [Oceanobacillus kimchii]|uniref:2-keto-4-pentenoate hydratase n=1 Tax=Oceanobacillus kimchii TaxID=746691 RepID=UPI000346D526|nr:2-keto-4-pentenoate hydratase [Oceanobacillus kimchii]
MSKESILEIVHQLKKAHHSKQPIPFIRDEFDLTEEEAYQVQELYIKHQLEENNVHISGYKVSMTSKETQAIASTHEPAYGTLLSNHVISSGRQLSKSELFQPLIEPELIFIVNEDLTLDAEEAEILQKTSMAAGIEIPDARYIDWFPNFSLIDLLSDNTATGRVIIAEPVPILALEQLGNIPLKLYHNGEKIKEAFSSAVLDNPIHAVRWLSQKLALHGTTLKKGMIISSGTFISPIPLKIGHYEAVYPGVGKAEITIVN